MEQALAPATSAIMPTHGSIDQTHTPPVPSDKPHVDHHQGKNRRREPRFQPNIPVSLKVLGWPPGPIMDGHVRDVSGSGMRVRVPLPVACGASVQIESNGTLSLGEICRCNPVEDAYELGIQLSHTLASLKQLDQATREQIEYEHRVWSRTRS